MLETNNANQQVQQPEKSPFEAITPNEQSIRDMINPENGESSQKAPVKPV